MFYEKCSSCRDSIMQNYLGPTTSNRTNDSQKPVTRQKRYCTRFKRFVQDYQTCEDWMPKNNV